MNPGPIHIYKCPNCENLLKNRTLISGNTSGAKYYSDAYIKALMLPEYPNLTKCKKCDTIFWLYKLRNIASLSWLDENNKKWANSEWAEFLTIDDYFVAITNGIAQNRREELFIRQHLWWAYNDRIRKYQEIFIDGNDEMRWEMNLKVLLTSLNYSDVYQRLLMAEINKNLGDFENCKRIIQSIDADDLNWLKKQFLKECERKNKWVIELSYDDMIDAPHFKVIDSELQTYAAFYQKIKVFLF
jgi:hypothetical protein